MNSLQHSILQQMEGSPNPLPLKNGEQSTGSKPQEQSAGSTPVKQSSSAVQSESAKAKHVLQVELEKKNERVKSKSNFPEFIHQEIKEQLEQIKGLFFSNVEDMQELEEFQKKMENLQQLIELLEKKSIPTTEVCDCQLYFFLSATKRKIEKKEDLQEVKQEIQAENFWQFKLTQELTKAMLKYLLLPKNSTQMLNIYKPNNKSTRWTLLQEVNLAYFFAKHSDELDGLTFKEKKKKVEKQVGRSYEAYRKKIIELKARTEKQWFEKLQVHLKGQM